LNKNNSIFKKINIQLGHKTNLKSIPKVLNNGTQKFPTQENPFFSKNGDNNFNGKTSLKSND
jgi:hypothetical protein